MSASDDPTVPPRWNGPTDLLDSWDAEPDAPLFAGVDDSVAPGDDVDGTARSSHAGSLVVVTGAAGPLGSAIARHLAAEGAIVCLVGRDVAPLVGMRRSLDVDAAAPVLVCDLADGDDVIGVTEFIARLGRPVDLVVHAAGLQADSTVAATPVESLDEHYLLNVRGPYQLTQRLLPLMRAGRGGCVFFAAPDSPATGSAHHSITRAAAAAMARELGREVAAAGLRVIEVETSDGPRAASEAEYEVFAEGLARTVLGAIDEPAVEVTRVQVHHRGRVNRTEQR